MTFEVRIYYILNYIWNKYPIPTVIFRCAISLGPNPDTRIMTASGTAPSNGRTKPPKH